jgi:hypothetical protein
MREGNLQIFVEKGSNKTNTIKDNNESSEFMRVIYSTQICEILNVLCSCVLISLDTYLKILYLVPQLYLRFHSGGTICQIPHLFKLHAGGQCKIPPVGGALSLSVDTLVHKIVNRRLFN